MFDGVTLYSPCTPSQLTLETGKNVSPIQAYLMDSKHLRRINSTDPFGIAKILMSSVQLPHLRGREIRQPCMVSYIRNQNTSSPGDSLDLIPVLGYHVIAPTSSPHHASCAGCRRMYMHKHLPLSPSGMGCRMHIINPN